MTSRNLFGGNQSTGTTLRMSDILELQALEVSDKTMAVADENTVYKNSKGKTVTKEEYDNEGVGI